MPTKTPKAPFTISKETTYITEPLRADGYPDYIAALNRLCSEGVTPENNSAVLFWRAMGPKSIDEKIRDRDFEMLGMEPLPLEGEYFITSNEWVEKHKTPKDPDIKQSEI